VSPRTSKSLRAPPVRCSVWFGRLTCPCAPKPLPQVKKRHESGNDEQSTIGGPTGVRRPRRQACKLAAPVRGHQAPITQHSQAKQKELQGRVHLEPLALSPEYEAPTVSQEECAHPEEADRWGLGEQLDSAREQPASAAQLHTEPSA